MEYKELNSLVEGAINGDIKNFEKLLKEITQKILFNSFAILQDYHEAEDATQEVILIMHKKLYTLREPEAFNTWLHKTIRNVCFRIVEKRNKRK